jgi:putative addiction module killer protein
MEVKARELRLLRLDNGVPYLEWYNSIKDKRARVAIDARLQRVVAGNFGDHKFFRGIGEMRIDVGPGYRIYFAMQNDVIIVLLGGGDKSSQDKDIDKAVSIWEKYHGDVDRLR